ncbi:ROK family transcriptional regulator [Rathayibacter sp. YIM 133350]|uniref:ROK family transcriptional regulator n=1 Tax=Rathayibacter sp. YIM 133350 TaxID=3131992 RepID=UPI00307F9732
MPAITESSQAARANGGTAEQIRERNLSSILGWLHRDGALSRADLTRLSGLGRSTVGVVLAELAELGLIVERPAVARGAGRPSPIFESDPSIVAIAVNPEVDALHIGLIGMNGQVRRRARIAYEDGPPPVPQFVQSVNAVVAGMLAGGEWRVAGVGVAVPGQVRVSDGFVREATHLGWTDQPVGERLHGALGYPVHAANAAVLALRAESTFGAGRGIDDLFYIIGGASGIGGGAVSDGRLVFGTNGHAGEVGHVFVGDTDRRCTCGSTGCFETAVSRAELFAALGMSDSEEDELDERAATTDRPEALALMEKYRATLRHVLQSVVNLFNPSTVIIGGFLAVITEGREAKDLVGEAIRSAREGTTVLRGSSHPDLLLVGAAELVFAELIADPAGQAPAALIA